MAWHVYIRAHHAIYSPFSRRLWRPVLKLNLPIEELRYAMQNRKQRQGSEPPSWPLVFFRFKSPFNINNLLRSYCQGSSLLLSPHPRCKIKRKPHLAWYKDDWHNTTKGISVANLIWSLNLKISFKSPG